MRNPELLRRLLLNIRGGSVPYDAAWYMQYIGNGSAAMEGSGIDTNSRKNYKDQSVFNGDFSRSPSNYEAGGDRQFYPFFPNMCGEDHAVISNIPQSSKWNPLRLFDYEGMMRTLVASNTYMGDNGETQTHKHQAVYALPMEPAVPMALVNDPDSIESGFGRTPDIVATRILSTTDFVFGNTDPADYIHLQHSSVDRLRQCLITGGWSVPTIDPYALGTYADANINDAQLYLSSSEYEYDPLLPEVRASGFIRGYSMLVQGPQAMDYDMLKLTCSFPSMETQPFFNSLMLILRHRCNWLHKPVVVFNYPNGKIPRIIGPAYSWAVARSFHRAGFGSRNDILQVVAGTRSQVYVSVCAQIIKPGSYTGTADQRAQYLIEKRIDNIVNESLTNHLPLTDDQGMPARYFGPEGTFIGALGTGAYDRPKFCLQPVAFPWCQAQDSLDLYFISMDDDYRYWLNRHRIGVLNSAVCLLELSIPPVDMLIHNNIVYMAYNDGVHTYNVSTGMRGRINGTRLVSAKTTSLCVNETNNHVYAGHVDGVTDLTANIKYDATVFTGTNADDGWKLSVLNRTLVVLGNRILWLSGDDLIQGKNGDGRAAFTVLDIDSGNYKHFSWHDLHKRVTSSIWNMIYGASLRSNGQVVVMSPHPDSDIFGFAQSNIRVVDVVVTGKNAGVVGNVACEAESFGIGMEMGLVQQGHRYKPTRMVRICDTKYAIALIPYYTAISKYNDSTFRQSATAQGMNLGLGGNNTKFCPHMREFYIDETQRRIQFDPYISGFTDYDPHSSQYRNKQLDPMNFFSFYPKLIPMDSLFVRVVDYEYCVASFGFVRYKNAVGPMFAGYQQHGHGGMPCEWDAQQNKWIPETCRTPNPRTVDDTLHVIDEHVGFRFINTSMLEGDVYRVDYAPGNSQLVDLTMYVGDFERTNRTATLETTVYVLPESKYDEFHGVEVNGVYCVINGNGLTRVSENPQPMQFTVNKNGTFVFNAAQVGQTVTLYYMYVKAVV